MAVKRTGQLGFVDGWLAPGRGAGSDRLDRLTSLVKWYRFEKLLGRLRGAGPGRGAYAPLLMFKALLLQFLYRLSHGPFGWAPGDPPSVSRVIRSWPGPAPFGPTPICRLP